ncbi:MAG: DUF885 domain-containing protein [Streptosporangiaceae bacterium]|nr:DUF885 domain-containing protein [Streptosporangiaceae bacterium]
MTQVAPYAPEDDNVVDEYLGLGLRLGRLVSGFVDCWFGDPRIAERVRAEPRPDPADLARSAVGLRDRVADSGLDERRQRFLTTQLKALECTARRLAGEKIEFAAEIRAYFDVDIAMGSPDRYADAHRAIADLLPGTEPLSTRLEAYHARIRIPPDKLMPTVQSISGRMAAHVRDMFPLPAADQIRYEMVHDKPWNAFNRYLGGFRSEVAVNAKAGDAIAALPTIITHESYPGHHTEHCIKESELVRGRGEEEHTISLVNTPQCLLSEGMAEKALRVVMPEGWGPWTSEILASHGLHIDGELVERVHNCLRSLLPVRQDAAIMLHERGIDPDDVVEHLQRWTLLSWERARHMVDFLIDPLWRSYTVTYIEGERLVDEWLRTRKPNQSIAENYLYLLRESPSPSSLEADVVAAKTDA